MVCGSWFVVEECCKRGRKSHALFETIFVSVLLFLLGFPTWLCYLAFLIHNLGERGTVNFPRPLGKSMEVSTAPPENEGRKKLPKCEETDGQKLAAFYLSENYVSFRTNQKNARGHKRVDKAQILEEGKKKAQEAIQRWTTLQAQKAKSEQLDRDFQANLKTLCESLDLDLEVATNFFVADKCTGSQHYSYQREFDYRKDVNSRLKKNARSRIAAKDRAQWEDWFDEHKNEIPIQEFICTDKIAWRPRISGAYKVSSDHDAPQLGRYTLTIAEKDAGVTRPDGEAAKGLPWLSQDRHLMINLLPLVNEYQCFRLHFSKQRKKAIEQFNTHWRPKKQFEKKRKDRAHSPPRERQARPNDDDFEEYEAAPEHFAISENTLSTVILHSDPSENRIILEEIAELDYTWKQIAELGTGEWQASVNWIYELCNILEHTECLVWDCDVAYETPDGTKFRSLEDCMSYVSPKLEEIFDAAKEGDGELVYEEADRLFKVFFKDDEERVFHMAPYAARMDGNRNVLNIDFITLFKYYDEIFQDVKELLEDWRQAFDGQNGGSDLESIEQRQFILDDPIFGDAPIRLRSEMLPPLIGSIVKRRTKFRTRRRRRKGDEGLPKSQFEIVNEVQTGHSKDWMAWVGGRFYTQAWPSGVWTIMPLDSRNRVRPLGWTEVAEVAEVAEVEEVEEAEEVEEEELVVS